ncbi:MAG: hypothetical protein JO169_09325, partial [Solirubrobacterales bacterium]|nr:hypothetical protein [Solirubrobacterales bacterium]
PAAAYWIWWLLVLTLLASALILARPRERLLLVGMTLFALVFPVAFDAWIYHYSGFPLQARYVLPVLVLVPLLAGETVLAHRARVGRSRTRRLIPLAFAVAGAFQLWSWVEAVSAAAHRSPRLALHPAASWQPPLGWVPWALLAALGALAIAGSGTASARGPLAEQLA